MDNGASSYRRFLNGDDQGIIEIVKEYKNGLILFINKYVSDLHTAEDLAEDTFFKLIVKKPAFDGKYSIKTWLYTVGRNTALNYLKRRDNRVCLSAEETARMVEEEKQVEKEYFRMENKIQLLSAINSLSVDYRTAIYLKYFEDMSNGQIGIIMQKSKRQVENLLHNGKKALKKELEKEGFIYENF